MVLIVNGGWNPLPCDSRALGRVLMLRGTQWEIATGAYAAICMQTYKKTRGIRVCPHGATRRPLLEPWSPLQIHSLRSIKSNRRASVFSVDHLRGACKQMASVAVAINIRVDVSLCVSMFVCVCLCASMCFYKFLCVCMCVCKCV